MESAPLVSLIRMRYTWPTLQISPFAANTRSTPKAPASDTSRRIRACFPSVVSVFPVHTNNAVGGSGFGVSGLLASSVLIENVPLRRLVGLVLIQYRSRLRLCYSPEPVPDDAMALVGLASFVQLEQESIYVVEPDGKRTARPWVGRLHGCR